MVQVNYIPQFALYMNYTSVNKFGSARGVHKHTLLRV